ncbi:MAG: AAA family ATPase [Gammaproteobacteria bacterium]|nr:MAG: AAA family ATPase [Gammaproteobacteria bacterium]
MNHRLDLPLSLWRTVGLHDGISEIADRLPSLLAEHLSVATVVVRSLEANDQLTTVATGGAMNAMPPLRSEVPGVRAWCVGGSVALSNDRGSATVPRDLWVGIEADFVLACPLRLDAQGEGVLFLIPPRGADITHAQRAVADTLIDPMSSALQRYRRLREFERQRIAATEGRQELARRLGSRAPDAAIVGAEGDLREVMERVDLVADSDLSVLLLGETGSGKEVIARAIHDRSRRAAAPFIRVNCGAIPAELIDSVLFGHERGSFTGAVAQRQGWFERADGGSLFLDEIGELPRAAQVRLLRVLQEGVIERVGGQQPVLVNVRIIAATHRDLAAMVAEGTFREDLWYRVAGFPIQIPPVRHRLRDVPALAEYMTRRSADRLGLPLVLPTEADLSLLRAYHWPGNVRELAAVIDRAVILGQGRSLEIASAIGPIQPRQALRAATAPSVAGAFATLEEVQRQHILRALERTHGRVAGDFGAARLLDLNPNTLRSKMRKLGISA